MTDLNYRKQIFIPLVTVSLILLIAMLWIFISAQQLIKMGKTKVRIEETRYKVTFLLNAMVDAETGQRGYQLTGNTQFLEPYERSLITTGGLIKDLNGRVKDFDYLKAHLKDLPALIDKKFDIIKRNIQTELMAGSFSPHLRPQDRDGKMVMDQIREKLSNADKALATEGNLLVERLDDKERALTFGALLIAFLIISILLFSYYRTGWLFENAKGNLKLAEEFGHLAMHDPLTRLPNRRSFDEHLAKAIANAQRKKHAFALFYMDLDGFKSINDTFGHDVGDGALIVASTRIKEVIRGSELLARVGGDEFALIVEDFTDQTALGHLATRIIASMEKPVLTIQHKEIKLGISIGIASYPLHARDGESLISAADSAMYISKGSGKNRYTILESA
jgi:diguanylate cyclase (GGDEF)-like protein